MIRPVYRSSLDLVTNLWKPKFFNKEIYQQKSGLLRALGLRNSSKSSILSSKNIEPRRIVNKDQTVLRFILYIASVANFVLSNIEHSV